MNKTIKTGDIYNVYPHFDGTSFVCPVNTALFKNRIEWAKKEGAVFSIIIRSVKNSKAA